jgi:hypothetical protein
MLTIGSNCDVIIGATSATILDKNLNLGKNLLILPGGTFKVNQDKVLSIDGELGL